MPPFIDHLADLTGRRDHDALDVSLVQALRDVIRPQRVALYRTFGDANDPRWILSAQLRSEDLVATSDPAWIHPSELPKLEDRPHWALALRQGAALWTAEGLYLAALALVADETALGVVEIETRTLLSDDTLRLLQGILRIYRNVQALLEYSEHDTLTGLLNRKSFDETFYKLSAPVSLPGPAGPGLGDERRRAVAQEQVPRYWLGVIDIDHFKHVNDQFGHLIGDEVLLLLSRVMRATFRYHDRLYRFGGEEFVVLLRCPQQSDAMAALERFRRAVGQYAFPQVHRVTVSIGFTDVRSGDTPSAAVERADKAVYYAKNHGRDQTWCHADLVAQGQLDDGDRDSDVELF